jgi:hypothetical protein
MMTPRSFLFTRQKPCPQTSPKKSKPRESSTEQRNRPTRQETDDGTSKMAPAETDSRPTTPSSPVIIPSRGNRDNPFPPRHELRKDRRQNGERKLPERSGRYAPGAISPSVAALLANTSIPPPRSSRSIRKGAGSGQRLTVDAILRHTDVSEKEFSISLGRGPLDLLLSPPDEADMEELTVSSDAGNESFLSTRTMSTGSIPSLDDESITGPSPSLYSLATPSSRGRKSLPIRRLQSVGSPPGDPPSAEDHPLSNTAVDIDELDFRFFQPRKSSSDQQHVNPLVTTRPPQRKSAFKSNLTSSLKAISSAARSSFSSFTAPMVLPEDFLTRSIITIDPQVPFTDERMPPRLEDTPTPALRRYLNPTTNAPIEAHVPSSLPQTIAATKCTASIQMQTYKVSRVGKSTLPSIISRRTHSIPEDVYADVASGPVARQRDMRENSDFIRIAVMEMAMRKNGKLDDRKPGRARWALPPRKPSTRPYQIGEDGVPTRWVAITR